MTVREFWEINPADYYGVTLSEEQILRWFIDCDAVWLHDGNPENPHAELTSGMCSNGFFDCLRVLRYPNLTEVLAIQLAQKIRPSIQAFDIILIPKSPLIADCVVGSPYAAITFSYEVAKALGVHHYFVEKDPADQKGKRMVWRRTQLPTGTRILQIEELITTSGTLREVRRAIQEGNKELVVFLEVVGVLVHRPPKLPADYSDLGVRQVVSLIEKEVWAVPPKECPLCAQGSKRLRPKQNWAELTGRK